MNVASLELCKELYKRSGWRYDAGKNGWWYTNSRPDGELDTLALATSVSNSVPAYDLGYLLRKLPPVILEDTADMKSVPMVLHLWINGDGEVRTAYLIPYDEQNRGSHQKAADTPEDAAAKLAIELFKQGILTKEVA